MSRENSPPSVNATGVHFDVLGPASLPTSGPRCLTMPYVHHQTNRAATTLPRAAQYGLSRVGERPDTGGGLHRVH